MLKPRVWTHHILDMPEEQFLAMPDEQVIETYQRETVLELARAVERLSKAQHLTMLDCPGKAQEELDDALKRLQTATAHLGFLKETREMHQGEMQRHLLASKRSEGLPGAADAAD